MNKILYGFTAGLSLFSLKLYIENYEMKSTIISQRDSIESQRYRIASLSKELEFFRSFHVDENDPKGLMALVYPPLPTKADKMYADFLKKEAHKTKQT